jgi:Cu(I)/Ag(I) efflux system membrane fusion protein
MRLIIISLLLFSACTKENKMSQGAGHDHAAMLAKAKQSGKEIVKEEVKKEASKPKIETYYTCSMHPDIKEQGPGKCPICMMNLTKIEIEHDESDHEVVNTNTSMGDSENSFKVVAKVKLRKSQIDHFKADLFPVTTMMMSKTIRLLGTLVKSQEKESNIPARVAGRVEKVFIQSKGTFVKRGDPVIKLYSPHLLTGGEEYLISRKNYFNNRDSKDFREIYEQSIQRMKLWGVLEYQLESWARRNKVPREITLYSPVTGIVEKKNAVVGKYFKQGQSFFDLVDLSSMWVELDVYEHDSALLKLGQTVKIEFSAYSGEVWKGEIDFIDPILDPKTRTLKVRTTLQNESGKLRPGMVGDAKLLVNLEGMPLVVPRTAIIDTGKRKVVWLDLGKNKYQAKSILTGFESDGYVEVKKGLSEGEKVVMDGNFLLDAQAQLTGGYEEEL